MLVLLSFVPIHECLDRFSHCIKMKVFTSKIQHFEQTLDFLLSLTDIFLLRLIRIRFSVLYLILYFDYFQTCKRKRKIVRRTIRDILPDICTTCREITEVRWNLEELLIEVTKLGHVKCLEAALSLGSEKSAWDRDRSRKYVPGGRTLRKVRVRNDDARCKELTTPVSAAAD